MKKIMIDNAIYEIPEKLHDEIQSVYEGLIHKYNDYDLYSLFLLCENATLNYEKIETGITTPRVEKPEDYEQYKQEQGLDEELYPRIMEEKLPF